MLEQLNARFPDLLLARCAQARFECEIGQPERARSFFETLAARGVLAASPERQLAAQHGAAFRGVPGARRPHRGAQLYGSLRPYHALAASAAESAFYGSISHHLGGLATLLSEPAAAAAHFETRSRCTAGWVRAPGSPTPSTTSRACCWPAARRAIATGPDRARRRCPRHRTRARHGHPGRAGGGAAAGDPGRDPPARTPAPLLDLTSLNGDVV